MTKTRVLQMVLPVMPPLVAAFILAAQTRVSPAQLKETIAVVEWSKCQGGGTNADGSKYDCTGMEAFRFRMADGSLKGPYYAIPAPTDYASNPKVTWVPVPLK